MPERGDPHRRILGFGKAVGGCGDTDLGKNRYGPGLPVGKRTGRAEDAARRPGDSHAGRHALTGNKTGDVVLPGRTAAMMTG